MQNILEILKKYFKQNNPVIVVNIATQKALLCLNPEFEPNSKYILLKFESLNERGGNNIVIKKIEAYEDQTLYVENDKNNILMLQSLNLSNYKFYIQPQYSNTPDFDNLQKLQKYILEQKPDIF